VRFEWDSVKAASNFRKHRVSFDEAVTVFRDPLARIVDDPDHSAEENREIAIGYSLLNRLLFVFFTERDVGTVRVFSARLATELRRDEQLRVEPAPAEYAAYRTALAAALAAAGIPVDRPETLSRGGDG